MLNEALTLLGYGLQPLPVNENKIPSLKWGHLQKEFLTESGIADMFAQIARPVGSIGVITGAVSGYLEVIDVDTKYDLTGELFTNFWSLIKDNLPDVAQALVIGQTRSGGYHLYYRCPDLIQLPKLPGNTKLANREATTEERALKDEKLLVLIETRGEGGYVVAPPTTGYKIIQGDLSAVPSITLDDRNYLIGIARSLTEYIEPESKRESPTGSGQVSNDENSPFDDYNRRGDVVALLESKGWTFVKQEGQRAHLKRPGQSDARTSGNFHEGKRTFFVFSSSTEFPEMKGISPSSVYVTLECNGDTKEAYRRLLAAGFGKPRSHQKKKQERVKTDSIRVDASDANGEEFDLTEDGFLSQESINNAAFDCVYVSYATGQDTKVVVEALNLIEKSTTKKVYLREWAKLSDAGPPIRTVRGYEYRAYDIIHRYDQSTPEGATRPLPEVEDQLLDEFVTLGLNIADPLDRGRYEELIFSFSDNNQLDITKEALDKRLEKMRFDQQREAQRSAITELLKDAGELNGKGDMSEALTKLKERGREISTIASGDTFKVLTTPIREADMMERISKKSADLKTGYLIGDEELLLPAGAITIIAAPTSHGKTTFLLNLALRAVEELPDKNIYVLSYEEDADSVTISAMNTYIGMQEKSHNDRLLSANHRRSIRSYYRGQDYFASGKKVRFEKYKNLFFDNLISTGKLSVQYAEYDADTLNEAIRYLHKHGNAGAVFIDYVQLIRMKETKLSRQLELKDICLDMKDVAVETGLPITLGAQFSREVINAARMHPTKIGESGDIERAANVIVGFWNNQFLPFGVSSDDELKALNSYRHDKNLLYAKIMKNRGGRVGVDGMLLYDGNTGVIENEPKGFVASDMVAFDAKSFKF